MRKSYTIDKWPESFDIYYEAKLDGFIQNLLDIKMSILKKYPSASNFKIIPDSCEDPSYNIYFQRDLTQKEKETRQKQLDKVKIQRAEQKKRQEQFELEEYLRLKEKFGD